VKLLNETMDLIVSPPERVRKIKDQIQEKKGIAYNTYKLRINGTKEIADTVPDIKTGIKNNTELEIFFNKIGVYVDVDDANQYLSDVLPNDPVSVLKEKLFKKAKITADQYNLTKGGVTLKNDTIIYSAGIKHGTQLVANFKTIQINVKIDTEEFPIEVDPDNKVKTIKDAILEIKNVTADKYTLKKGTTTLHDTWSIFDSKINEGDTVTADLKLFSFKVNMTGLYNPAISIDPNEKVS
jgi:hypothetical protein